MLRDVSQLDVRVKLLGEWVEFPICVAPTAMQCMAHPEGEAATARGTAGSTVSKYGVSVSIINHISPLGEHAPLLP